MIGRVLVVAAHPDDIDFGAAATVALWTGAGVAVTYCIVTDGDAGGSDRSVERADMARLRRSEQAAAAAVCGVSDVRFLGYPDGRVTSSLELRRDICRVIRDVRPDRVVAPSPERSWTRVFASHPDHLAAGEAAVCAVYPDARNPFAHPELLEQEGLEPHSVGELWLMASPAAFAGPQGAQIEAGAPAEGNGATKPDPRVSPPLYPGASGTRVTAVDVTETFDRKVAALRAHASQTAHMEDLEGMLRGWQSAGARSYGLAEGRLAEAFQVVTTA